MRRRTLLAGAGAGMLTPLAGCIGNANEDTTSNNPSNTSNTQPAPTADHDDETPSEPPSDCPPEEEFADTPIEPTDAWSQFQANAAHIGATTAAGPTGGGQVRWWSDTWGVATAPVIDDGRVYIGSGLRNQAVFAFDQDTGEQRWRAPIDEDIDRALAVHNGTVYVSADGIYALDAETGEEEWNELLTSSQGVTIADETIFTAAGFSETIVALEADSGEERWSRDIRVTMTPSVANGMVFVASGDTLYALDAACGETEWKRTMSIARDPPIITNDTVYVPTEEDIAAFAVATGQAERAPDGRFPETDIATMDGMLYLTGKQEVDGDWVSRALAVDTETNDIAWTQDDDHLDAGTSAVTEETIYVAANRGEHQVRPRLYALDRTTGEIEWWLRFQWPVGSPAVGDGTLFVPVGGRLLAIESGESPAGVYQVDARHVPDSTHPEPTYPDTAIGLLAGMGGFDVRSTSEVTVDDGGPGERLLGHCR